MLFHQRNKKDVAARTQRPIFETAEPMPALTTYGCMQALPREAHHEGDDRHGEQNSAEPKPLSRLGGLQLVHFPFAFGGGTMTRPSLKTVFSKEANSGSARIASATLNEGSGSHLAPLLTSDSAASVIA